MNRYILLMLSLVLFPALISCPGRRVDDAARIHFLIGTVDVRSSSKKIQPVVGGVLGKDDLVETAQKSSCDLLFADQMLVRIGEQTRVVVGAIKEKTQAALDLSRGKIMVIFTRLGKESELRIKGTTVTIAVRGTVFAFFSDEHKSSLAVLDGTVEMEIGAMRASTKKFAVSAGNSAAIAMDDVEALLSGKKELSLRKLSESEKNSLLNELTSIQQESVSLLSPPVRSAFADEIAKVMNAETAEQKKRRDAEAKAELKRLEEARKKAELEEALRKKAEEERLRKEAEEAERLKREAEEAERRRKEAEEAEKKKLQEKRKAVPKKTVPKERKDDRSTDTSGN